MINIKTLKETDIGKWVEYRSSGGEKVERGKIKSWNDKFVFVVYSCNEEWDRFQDFTGESTRPEDLFWSHQEMNHRLYIIYDGRAAFGDTDDATVMVACDSVDECWSYLGDFGDDCVVYSYLESGNDLIDERFEFILSGDEKN